MISVIRNQKTASYRGDIPGGSEIVKTIPPMSGDIGGIVLVREFRFFTYLSVHRSLVLSSINSDEYGPV